MEEAGMAEDSIYLSTYLFYVSCYLFTDGSLMERLWSRKWVA